MVHVLKYHLSTDGDIMILPIQSFSHSVSVFVVGTFQGFSDTDIGCHYSWIFIFFFILKALATIPYFNFHFFFTRADIFAV